MAIKKSELYDKINKIISRLAEANDLKGVIDIADFNDAEKLGKGKEMDNATAVLAKMNMILHDSPTAEIWKDNSLSSPHFKQADDQLKTFDFVVANPPFSTKAWSNGFNPAEDDYNLNLPRYIDSSEAEDLQDINAHLNGGIPNRDIDHLDAYWQLFPSLRAQLFISGNAKPQLGADDFGASAELGLGAPEAYSRLNVEAGQIKTCIFSHGEFGAFIQCPGDAAV